MRGSSSNDYPALKLDELLPIRDFEDLSDEEMTDLVTRALVDPGARRPSIETLLHAFLPYTHIDHVHADAICTLTNHAEGPTITKEALGEGFAYIDWMRPGFNLSKIVGELNDYQGVVLAHHGLITWGDDSETCYQQTISAVEKARSFVESSLKVAQANRQSDHEIPEQELRSLLTRLRGRVSRGSRRVLRLDDRLRKISQRQDLETVIAGGASSADHMLRIKPRSVLVPRDIDEAIAAIDTYETEYLAYVDRNIGLLPEGCQPHEPLPKVMLIPGVGAVTTGINEKDALIAADIATHTHQVAANVLDAFGKPLPLSEVETFRFDYWPMELYKLQLKPKPPQFAGHVFIVTGASSGIGAEIARQLANLGASLVLADIDESGLSEVTTQITQSGGVEPLVVAGDQSDPMRVQETVNTCVDRFGGLDGIVANAGVGVTGFLKDLSLTDWQKAIQINLTSAFLLTKAAMPILIEQGLGGSLVYVASKNAFGPGAGFGAYSVSKAGMVQLAKIAALEGGKYGIRSNAINPDAVFDNSKLWGSGLREERAAAHGIKPEELEDFYASRNLLNRHVTTIDVAHAAVFLLSDASSRTTGAVLPVDGGVAGAFPR
jgi:rhamnose utilization protein RhaD (predicted bifunctional aldolase and dehydrogenase)/NAD(P)-dependent dehydrogenase (short-subunit alcohol dehydrogenase family)